MKILILDDVEIRHKKLRSFHKEDQVDSAYNIDDARALASNFKYDLMYLDHDLEDEHYKFTEGDYTEQGRERTGADFARWLVETKNYPPKVIVHSMNSYGAKNIWKILEPYCDAYPVAFMYTSYGEFGWKKACGIPEWDKKFEE